MPRKPADPFDDQGKHLAHLPDTVLRDLGRNQAAPRDYRKKAVEFLWSRQSPYVKHTDLQEFVAELEAEFEGIQFEFPAPEPTGPGPLTAGVTIASLYGSEPIENSEKIEPSLFTGFDGVQIMDKPEEVNLTIPDDTPKKPRKKKDTNAP